MDNSNLNEFASVDEMMDRAVSMKMDEVEKKLRPGYRVTITCNSTKNVFLTGKVISTSTKEILIMDNKVINIGIFNPELSWIHDVEVDHGHLKFKANEESTRFSVPLIDGYTRYIRARDYEYNGFSIFVQKVKFDKSEFV